MQLIVKTVGLHFSFSAFDMSHILCHVSDFIITLNQGSLTDRSPEGGPGGGNLGV